MITSLILILSVMGAGALVLGTPVFKYLHFRGFLIFSGAFLFSITVVHILPELFAVGSSSSIGIFILLGFFLQQILEVMSSGVEHGHVHNLSHHTRVTPLGIMLGLSIHAFLEGTLLAHPDTIHEQHNISALLLAIVLHKIPAAFALVSVVLNAFSRKMAWICLFIFSLASPLGLIVSHLAHNSSLISNQVFIMLFALVSGSFLHISTTIVFETSPEHHFKTRRFLAAVAGALLGVLTEILF